MLQNLFHATQNDNSPFHATARQKELAIVIFVGVKEMLVPTVFAALASAQVPEPNGARIFEAVGYRTRK